MEVAMGRRAARTVFDLFICSVSTPTSDYDRLTREISGRRINIAEPPRQPSADREGGREAVPHTGGKSCSTEDSEYCENDHCAGSKRVLPRIQGDIPSRSVSVEIYPHEARCSTEKDVHAASQRLELKYSDGTEPRRNERSRTS